MRDEPSIAHLDADAFFASVEQAQRPSLRGRPVLVGGTGPRGVVAAASYEARSAGVRSAMSMATARRLCPQATVVVPRFDAYSAFSARIMAALREVTDAVEPLSIDEAFADLRALTPGPDGWPGVARALRERAVDLAGVPVSVGMGRSKLVAKLASAAAKPAGVVVVDPAEEDAFLLPMRVRSLWGVGPVSAERLERIGVRTVADLRAQPLDTLTMVLGEAAGTGLFRVARGWDDRPVAETRERKSAGAEHTFESDLHGRAQVAAQVPAVAEQALARLERHGGAARTVTVKVRFAGFSTVSRSVTLPSPTADAAALVEAAGRALDLVDLTEPVRLLGVSFHGLSEHAQLMLDLPAGALGAGRADAAPDGPAADAPWTAPTTPDGEDTAEVRPVARRRRGRLRHDDAVPGLDVTHPEHGRGWVVRARDDGRVAIRFETAATGPGRQVVVDPEVDHVELVGALGPDGTEVAPPVEDADPSA
ncbi:DNA polymerase IV [Cellulomonas triticagri]|uniref:DNA polymerase IV n=2 Tax=Cellulomonas triticagri TaxID=2483352 RepID=A0A3M2JPL0_9CELL|nr:DNA polymerase IV [Cellulomonas triticagri]